jgi:hypothetical protein
LGCGNRQGQSVQRLRAAVPHRLRRVKRAFMGQFEK